MEQVVVDTSVIVKWFFTEAGSDTALEFLWKAKAGLLEIIVPELARYEFWNVLVKGKLVRMGDISEILSGFYSLPISFVSETLEMSLKSCKIADNLGITYYDACFLALAKKYGVPLVTANPRHQKAGTVEIISI